MYPLCVIIEQAVHAHAHLTRSYAIFKDLDDASHEIICHDLREQQRVLLVRKQRFDLLRDKRDHRRTQMLVACALALLHDEQQTVFFGEQETKDLLLQRSWNSRESAILEKRPLRERRIKFFSPSAALSVSS